MSNNDKVEGILDAIKKKNEPISGLNEKIIKEEEAEKGKLIKVDDVSATISMSEEESKNLGFVNKLKANKQRSDKQLEAQSVLFDTQIEKLKHQAQATERQSKAYWDAKSVDFTEGLKTYAQENMALLENARFENKSGAIQSAYEIAYNKINELVNGELPDQMKQELVEKIIEARDATVTRIEDDVLANKYDLGPDEQS